MRRSSITIIIIIIVVVILGIWIYSANNNVASYTQNSNANSSLNTNTNPVASADQNGSNQGVGVPSLLFSSSEYAQNSYLISVPTYDAKTKNALTGFAVTKKVLVDGSTQITLNAQNPEYQTQTYIVKTGEKLYFIESNLSDDNGPTDKFPGDDTAVLVDANGYIITGK